MKKRSVHTYRRQQRRLRTGNVCMGGGEVLTDLDSARKNTYNGCFLGHLGIQKAVLESYLSNVQLKVK